MLLIVCSTYNLDEEFIFRILLEFSILFLQYLSSIKLPGQKFTIKSDVKRCEGILLIG